MLDDTRKNYSVFTTLLFHFEYEDARNHSKITYRSGSKIGEDTSWFLNVLSSWGLREERESVKIR